MINLGHIYDKLKKNLRYSNLFENQTPLQQRVYYSELLTSPVHGQHPMPTISYTMYHTVAATISKQDLYSATIVKEPLTCYRVNKYGSQMKSGGKFHTVGLAAEKAQRSYR